MIPRRCPGLLFALFCAGSALAALGPETAVAPLHIGSLDTSPESLSIAAGDSGFLAAWDDQPSVPGVSGALLDRDGHRLHQADIRIAATGLDPKVAVVSDGAGYLVAIKDGQQTDVVRVSRNGEVGPRRHVLTTGGSLLAAASDGELTLILSGDRVAIIDHHGDLNAPLLTLPRMPVKASVATNGDGFAILTAASGRTEVMQVSAAGRVLRTDVLPTPGTLNHLGIASDGVDYLAVWGGSELLTQRVSRSGPFGAQQSLGPSSPLQSDAMSIVWSGSEYLAAFDWHGPSLEYRTILITPDGRLAGTGLLTTDPPYHPPRVALAAGPFGIAAIWNGGPLIWSRPQVALDSAAALLRPHKGEPLSLAVLPQHDPIVAGTPAGPVVFYGEGFWSARAIGLDAAGAPRTAPLDLDRMPQAAAWDGTNVVAVSTDGYKIFVRRYNLDLVPLGAEIVTGPGPRHTGRHFAIASRPGAVLVVWTTGSTDVYGFPGDLYSVLVRPTDTVETITVRRLVESDVAEHNPAVAWNGREFLVAWPATVERPRKFFTPRDDLLVMRVDAEGQQIDVTPFVIERNIEPADCRATANGGDVLLLYNGDSLTSRVFRDGNPYRMLPAVKLGPNRALAGVEPLGRSYLATTRITLSGFLDVPRIDVETQILGADGEAGEPWAVTSTSFPALAIAPSGPLLIYSHGDAAQGTDRLFSRPILTEPHRRAIGLE